MASALTNAVSGVQASLMRADVSANNTANINTTAFKSSRVNQVETRGGGTSVASITRDASQGALQTTGRPLDVAIEGRGSIPVQTSSGSRYTRDGALHVDADRFLSRADGSRVGNGIRVPVGSKGVNVEVDGSVYAQFEDRDRLIGNIDPVDFANYEGLLEDSFNTMEATAASGGPVASNSRVVSGALEASNTDLAREIVQQAAAEVGVSANVEVIRTADDLQGTLLDMVK